MVFIIYLGVKQYLEGRERMTLVNWMICIMQLTAIDAIASIVSTHNIIEGSMIKHSDIVEIT